MKLSLITLHSLTNPGSALQAFALQRFLLDRGYDAELIDYNPYYIFTGKHKIKTVIGKLLNWKEYQKREANFAAFRHDHMKVTPTRYRSYKALKASPPKADAYITGSDQIWNPDYDCGRDDAFYLGFVKDKPKLAYAASLGKAHFSGEEKDFITARARDFSFVSVREASSKAFLEANGVNNVSYVCDPTLLMDVTQYRDFMKMPDGIPEKYLLVYLVAQSELLDRLIDTVSKRYNLKVVQIGSFLKQCRCDCFLKDAGPREFVGLIANAECVIASSYHATVFSLIFHKPFYILPPHGNAARIEQLLETAGIDGRIVRKEQDFAEEQPIDYDAAQQKLDDFIGQSKDVFLTNLKKL